MDLDWLDQLAMSGATTLVGAAATEAWHQARAGFVRLFGGDPKRDIRIGRRLDELGRDVEQADVDKRDSVRQRSAAAWQTRLADLLEDDPGSAEALRMWQQQIEDLLPPAQQQWVQNIVATAPGAVAQGVMFGAIYNRPAPQSLVDDEQVG